MITKSIAIELGRFYLAVALGGAGRERVEYSALNMMSHEFILAQGKKSRLEVSVPRYDNEKYKEIENGKRKKQHA